MRIFARQKLTWQCRLIALRRDCAHPAGSTVAFVTYGVDYWLTGGLGIAQTPDGPQHPPTSRSTWRACAGSQIE
jgi:hypothetical protein